MAGLIPVVEGAVKLAPLVAEAVGGLGAFGSSLRIVESAVESLRSGRTWDPGASSSVSSAGNMVPSDQKMDNLTRGEYFSRTEELTSALERALRVPVTNW